jgi:hypothetical protein
VVDFLLCEFLFVLDAYFNRNARRTPAAWIERDRSFNHTLAARTPGFSRGRIYRRGRAIILTEVPTENKRPYSMSPSGPRGRCQAFPDYARPLKLPETPDDERIIASSL